MNGNSYSIVNQMGNNISCDGVVTTEAWGGSWGGSLGQHWSYKAEHDNIKHIIITCGDFINSIKFKDGSATADYSRTFGADGGTRTHKVDIDFPIEFLRGISGTYSDYFPCCVYSLKLYTNLSEYGPFGTELGDPFSFRSEGLITGFHGRASSHLHAIGVYLKPAFSFWMLYHSSVKEEHSEIDRRRMLGLVPRSPGPWGSINGGRVWDDGVFLAVKQVQVHVRHISGPVDAISAVRFGYQQSDGADFLSNVHGTDENEIYELNIDGVNEFLIGVEGFYGSVEGNGNVDVIRSLTFLTNRRSCGPYGYEIGKYFSSVSLMDGKKGRVVGFHGRSGAYVNAIGVHTEYILEKLSS